MICSLVRNSDQILSRAKERSEGALTEHGGGEDFAVIGNLDSQSQAVQAHHSLLRKRRQSLLFRPYDHTCLLHFAKCVAQLLAIAFRPHAQDEKHDQRKGHSHPPERRGGEFFVSATPLQFGYPTFHCPLHLTRTL